MTHVDRDDWIDHFWCKIENEGLECEMRSKKPHESMFRFNRMSVDHLDLEHMLPHIRDIDLIWDDISEHDGRIYSLEVVFDKPMECRTSEDSEKNKSIRCTPSNQSILDEIRKKLVEKHSGGHREDE